jgi:hypothetical protein
MRAGTRAKPHRFASRAAPPNPAPAAPPSCVVVHIKPRDPAEPTACSVEIVAVQTVQCGSGALRWRAAASSQSHRPRAPTGCFREPTAPPSITSLLLAAAHCPRATVQFVPPSYISRQADRPLRQLSHPGRVGRRRRPSLKPLCGRTATPMLQKELPRCACGDRSAAPPAFSLLFPKPMGLPAEQWYCYHEEGGASPYGAASTPIDCTLSLGTPSTRRAESAGVAAALMEEPRQGSPPRRCANCDTTSTPLWRNGPRGPKVCPCLRVDTIPHFFFCPLFSRGTQTVHPAVCHASTPCIAAAMVSHVPSTARFCCSRCATPAGSGTRRRSAGDVRVRRVRSTAARRRSSSGDATARARGSRRRPTGCTMATSASWPWTGPACRGCSKSYPPRRRSPPGRGALCPRTTSSTRLLTREISLVAVILLLLLTVCLL